MSKEWKKLKAEFNTGDILLYHHKKQYNSWYDAFFSIFNSAIMWATKSEYSHSSIIIKDPRFTNPPLDGLYILESNDESFPDAEDHEVKFGIELVKLDDAMEAFHGDIYWRKLECKRDADFYQNLADAHSIAHNRPYDLNPSDWFKAAFQIKRGDIQKEKTFWCSALTAFVYTKLGLLPKDTPWTLVSPKMLGTEDVITEVKYRNCTLLTEKKIKSL